MARAQSIVSYWQTKHHNPQLTTPMSKTKTLTLNEPELQALEAIFDAALRHSGQKIVLPVAFLTQKIASLPYDSEPCNDPRLVTLAPATVSKAVAIAPYPDPSRVAPPDACDRRDHRDFIREQTGPSS